MLERQFKSTSGFSLTEVMIGIMILTVAIVSASNLLVSMVKTNKVNVQSLQAYYLAQEGIEAVRNIRDTNWLHNLDFMGKKGLYGELKVGDYYYVSLDDGGWKNSNNPVDADLITDLNSMKAWKFANSSYSKFNSAFGLVKDDTGGYIGGAGTSDDPGFYRYIQILNACDNDAELEASLLPEECKDFMLVRSVVEWNDGGKARKMALETVLSNWKGGAL